MNRSDPVSDLQSQARVQQAEHNSQHRQLNELRSQVASLTFQLQEANVRAQWQVQPQNLEIESLKRQISALQIGMQAANERAQQAANNALMQGHIAADQRRTVELEHQLLLRTQSEMNGAVLRINQLTVERDQAVAQLAASQGQIGAEQRRVTGLEYQLRIQTQTQLIAASSTIQQLTVERDQAVGNFRQLQVDFAKLTDSWNQVSATATSRDEEINRGNERYQKAQAEFDQRMLQATSTIEESNQKIRELTAEKQNVEEMLGRVQGDLNGLRETWNTVSSSRDAEIERLKEDLSTSQEKIKSLELEHAEQLEKTKADLSASHKQIESLQEQLKDINQQLQWAREDAEISRKYNDSLNTSSSFGSQTRVEELEHQLFENERQANLAGDRAASENWAKQQEIDQLNQRLSVANQEVRASRENIQVQLNQLNAQHQILVLGSGAKQQEIDQLKQQVQAQSDQLNAQQQAVSSMEAQAQNRALEFAQTLLSKDAEIDALKKQLEAQRTRGQQTVDDLCSLYQTTAQERDQLRLTLAQLYVHGAPAAK